jgi:hypothetical protein
MILFGAAGSDESAEWVHPARSANKFTVEAQPAVEL